MTGDEWMPGVFSVEEGTPRPFHIDVKTKELRTGRFASH